MPEKYGYYEQCDADGISNDSAKTGGTDMSPKATGRTAGRNKGGTRIVGKLDGDTGSTTRGSTGQAIMGRERNFDKGLVDKGKGYAGANLSPSPASIPAVATDAKVMQPSGLGVGYPKAGGSVKNTIASSPRPSMVQYPGVKGGHGPKPKRAGGGYGSIQGGKTGGTHAGPKGSPATRGRSAKGGY